MFVEREVSEGRLVDDQHPVMMMVVVMVVPVMVTVPETMAGGGGILAGAVVALCEGAGRHGGREDDCDQGE